MILRKEDKINIKIIKNNINDVDFYVINTLKDNVTYWHYYNTYTKNFNPVKKPIWIPRLFSILYEKS